MASTTIMRPADVARALRKAGVTNANGGAYDATDVRKYVRDHAPDLTGQDWPTERTTHLYSPDLFADIVSAMTGDPASVLKSKRETKVTA